MTKILSGISVWLNEGCLRRRVKRMHRKPVFTSLVGTERILLVWNAPADCRACIDELKSLLPGREVDGICFVPDGVADPAVLPEGTVCLKRTDFRMGGRVENPAVGRFLQKHYGLVLAMGTGDYVLPAYVLRSVKQTCVVGMEKDRGLVDVVVAGIEDRVAFVREVIRFLSEIKKE